MGHFEGTQSDFIKSKSSELIENARIGRVVEVYEHLDTSDSDHSNFELDVIIDELNEERTVSYNMPAQNITSPPSVGDRVIIEYMQGEKKRPQARDIVYTVDDRPPLGRAGMHKNQFEAGDSPVGDGDMNVTGYTKYTDNPAKVDTASLDPVETWVQVAKHPATPDPPLKKDVRMRMEMYDSPVSEEDAAHILLEGNQIDGDDKLSARQELDFKSGAVTSETINENEQEELRVSQFTKGGLISVTATDTSTGDSIQLDINLRNGTAKLSGDGSNEMGMSLDFNNDSFTIVDGMGYGIESDGAGNFTWHHKSIDMVEDSTTSL